jgi:hypothetical protein
MGKEMDGTHWPVVVAFNAFQPLMCNPPILQAICPEVRANPDPVAGVGPVRFKIVCGRLKGIKQGYNNKRKAQPGISHRSLHLIT